MASKKTAKIPPVTIPRLSQYYRSLLECRKSDFISSEEIAQLSGFGAAQIRKDLAYFGQFGAPGKGYPIESLKQSIIKILGTDREWSVVVVGVGNLGSALLSYRGFLRQGFKIVCAFDSNPRKIGRAIRGIPVKDIQDLETEVRHKEADMAIVTVPQEAAGDVVARVARAGIRAILNFAPVRVAAPEGTQVFNIDLSIELERLAYFLTQSKK